MKVDHSGILLGNPFVVVVIILFLILLLLLLFFSKEWKEKSK